MTRRRIVTLGLAAAAVVLVALVAGRVVAQEDGPDPQDFSPVVVPSSAGGPTPSPRPTATPSDDDDDDDDDDGFKRITPTPRDVDDDDDDDRDDPDDRDDD